MDVAQLPKTALLSPNAETLGYTSRSMKHTQQKATSAPEGDYKVKATLLMEQLPSYRRRWVRRLNYSQDKLFTHTGVEPAFSAASSSCVPKLLDRDFIQIATGSGAGMAKPTWPPTWSASLRLHHRPAQLANGVYSLVRGVCFIPAQAPC